MRVLLAACFVCLVAFFAGVVGDLSMASQPEASLAHSGETARIAIPADAVRAHPLPVVVERRAPRRAHLIRVAEIRAEELPAFAREDDAFDTAPTVEADPALAQKQENRFPT